MVGEQFNLVLARLCETPTYGKHAADYVRRLSAESPLLQEVEPKQKF